jgi:hypothetical protein
MRNLLARLIVGGVLGCVAASTSTWAADANTCSPDMTTVVRLEAAAKQKGSIAVTAKSALRYFAEQNLPAAGYFMAKTPSSGGKGKLAFLLYHESGFKRACVTGNQSGMDGVLLVDAATREVERFELVQ